MNTATQVVKEINGNGAIRQPASKLSLKEAARKDAVSEPFPPVQRKSLMAKLDEAAARQVTFSQGTLWLIGTALVLATVIFNYGGSALTWARDDQATKEKMAQIGLAVQQIKEAQSKQNDKLEKIEQDLQQQRVADAVKRGYELKAAEGTHGGK